MDGCPLCQSLESKDSKYVLLEDEYAVATLAEAPFRPGNCIISLKRHLKSISELTDEENISVSKMIGKISKAMELNFKAEKTYLFCISDAVPHLHYHLLPKIDGQVSMGVYCFGKLVEAEGKPNISEQELSGSAEELKKLLLTI